MSRPGAWNRVFSNLWKYLKNDFSKKRYVAEDDFGNRYYQIENSRQNVSRGFDPPTSGNSSRPGIEWEAWLKGTRRFPPSKEEIFLNRSKQQAQLEQDARTEKRAPHVAADAPKPEDGPQRYPKYKDMEVTPGHREERDR
ncbi:unnamed protein product [Caenorhabditis auriculariae]|uniref:NADH dehydrogenase [ubiquinone] 1 alpha subcomplex subunit 12 n=1 Tax=Caenorhabditis auriculariae TaxID=2777116 RepID=A0A8S1HRU6_9PELO|nr:unnamed protein product [Caenorhabditis auriculariae]